MVKVYHDCPIDAVCYYRFFIDEKWRCTSKEVPACSFIENKLPKRAYFVHVADAVHGVGVIASSAKEAKRLAWHDEEFIDAEYIDLRATWMREAKVDDLPFGLIKDNLSGLRHGVYVFLEGGICDSCHEERHLESYKGQALCSECLEKV